MSTRPCERSAPRCSRPTSTSAWRDPSWTGIRARVVGEELSKSLSPGQQVVKAVHDELVEVLGGETLRLTYASAPPTVVLLAGLQGSGKTTTAAKLARWFRQQGRNPLLVGADLQRPAAVEQLRILGRAGRGAGLQRAHRSRRRGRRPVCAKRSAWAATCSSSTPPAAWPSTRRSWTRCGACRARCPRTTRSS